MFNSTLNKTLLDRHQHGHHICHLFNYFDERGRDLRTQTNNLPGITVKEMGELDIFPFVVATSNPRETL